MEHSHVSYNGMEVIWLDEHNFDVFWESGWNNWARIHNNKGFLKQTSGVEIPKHVFSQLIKFITGGK
jgi:hypothetical protein